MASKTEHSRGRDSQRPTGIPRGGWRDVAVRVAHQQGEDNISIVAAGVAFYAMFAIFPALTAAVSIYALVADPAQVQQQMQALSQMLPGQVRGLISNQLNRVVSGAGGALGLGAALGILIAFWSASKGTKSLLTALNIAYDEDEDRGFVRFNAVAVGLTVLLIIGVVLAVALVVALPIALNALGLGGFVQTIVSVARWLLLGLGLIAALAVLYRFGPSRSPAQWSWVTPGSIAATVMWLIASILFSIYVSNFGSYNATYGALGAVIILLLWLQISAYIVLIGAEINSETERQTRTDTTTGDARKMGHRRAYAADSVGKGRDAG